MTRKLREEMSAKRHMGSKFECKLCYVLLVIEKPKISTTFLVSIILDKNMFEFEWNFINCIAVEEGKALSFQYSSTVPGYCEFSNGWELSSEKLENPSSNQQFNNTPEILPECWKREQFNIMIKGTTNSLLNTIKHTAYFLSKV